MSFAYPESHKLSPNHRTHHRQRKGRGMNARTEPSEEKPAAVARPPIVRELLLVAGLFLVYKFGRQLATGHTAEAFRNAHRVWDWERTLHLPGEGSEIGRAHV